MALLEMERNGKRQKRVCTFAKSCNRANRNRGIV